MNEALSYRQEWSTTHILIGICGYLLFMGVIFGTSIRTEMPRFLLIFGVAFMTIQFAFIAAYRRVVDVDLAARTATVSLRWFGLNLAPRVHDLSATERVVVSNHTSHGYDPTRPQTRQHRPSDFTRVYSVALRGATDLDLLVFQSFREAEARERAGRWSEALRVPVEDATRAPAS
jgi:hypothetical protein